MIVAGVVDFAGNYLERGTVDIAALSAELSKLSDEDWLADRFRQETYPAHRDTQTIPLLFDADFRHAEPTRRESYARFAHVIEPIHDVIAGCFGNAGWIVRSLLVRLRPGGAIPPHVDDGFSLTNSHRLHIAVVTNAHALFRVGGELRHLKPGDVVEINNRRKHSASNDGAAPRVHLICDWAPDVRKSGDGEAQVPGSAGG